MIWRPIDGQWSVYDMRSTAALTFHCSTVAVVTYISISLLSSLSVADVSTSDWEEGLQMSLATGETDVYCLGRHGRLKVTVGRGGWWEKM